MVMPSKLWRFEWSKEKPSGNVRLYISRKQLECEDEINKEQTIFGNKVKYTIFSHSGSFLLVDFNLHIFRVLGIEFILDSRFT